VENDEVLRHVEELFRNHISTPISDINRMQALVPSTAEVLHNAYGTAPGMWFKKNGIVYISLPGVQFEMRQLLTDKVIPKLIATFERPFILHKTFLTYGLGESAIAARIEALEDALPEFVKLAYLPNLGKVRLRFTAKGSSKEVLQQAIDKASRELYEHIGDIIHGEENDSLESTVARLLTAKNKTLATAESFTGGRIAEVLTSQSGASVYFKGSIVSYATEVKTGVLQVPEDLVNKHSVVSSEVAVSMAANVRAIMKSDFAIATTGNAGPAKGDSDAEIGTVFIAIATPLNVFAEKFMMGNHRERVVEKSVHKGMEMLCREILKF
jgi:nicotinamide-nucleotide amidase